MNLRDVIELNIAKAEAEVSKYRDDLAELESHGGNFLDREIKELQTFVHKLANHLFSQTATEAVHTVAVTAPATSEVAVMAEPVVEPVVVASPDVIESAAT